ncbi:MAG: hypothetical protein ACLSVD_17130 [Eggerthellaceae bacterium]
MSDTVAAEYWTTVLGRVADSGRTSEGRRRCGRFEERPDHRT